jgi:hypothetical protein
MFRTKSLFFYFEFISTITTAIARVESDKIVTYVLLKLETVLADQCVRRQSAVVTSIAYYKT